MIGQLYGWMLRHPRRGAILVGIIVTVALALASFPREETVSKTVDGWLLEDASVDETARGDLLASLRDYQGGALADVVRVSEDEFRLLGLPVTLALPEVAEDGRAFVLRYLGKESPGAQRLILAERTIESGPWWSPDRWAYKALEAQAAGFANILILTYERDLAGLITVLFLDFLVGGAYGLVIGLILGVLGSAGLDRHQPIRPMPPPSPMPLGYKQETHRS